MTQQDAIYERFGLLRAIEPPETWEKGRPAAFTAATRKAYNFTTEDIASYINELDLDGRRLACIAGSGDLPVNAFLYGAAQVEAVDVSPVACVFSELKVAGVGHLEYDEFRDFFATRGWRTFGDGSFAYATYEKLRPHVSETARGYFDRLIGREGRHPYLAPGAMLISHTRKMYKVKVMSPYLQGRYRYGEARQRVRPVLFHPQPVDAFLAEHPATYDVVHLSNTHGYGGDPAHTVALAASALRRGGQVVLVEYTLEGLVDGHGSPVFVAEAERFGYPGREVVAPALNGKGSVKATILDVRA